MIRAVLGLFAGAFVAWLVMVLIGFTPANGELPREVAAWAWDGAKAAGRWLFSVADMPAFAIVVAGGVLGFVAGVRAN